VNEIAEHLDAGMATHVRKSTEQWATEEEAAAAFDERIERCGLFTMRKEVRGFYLTHRPNREEKDARIDRILVPGDQLKSLGWTMTVGVEIKKSECDFGAAVSQAIDYTYCTWNLGNFWMYCERIFLWPFAMPQGPLQSVMLQNGVGVVSGRRYRSSEFDRDLVFQLERQVITTMTDGKLESCVPTVASHRKGSR
jgi:hypothetical protein